MGAVLKFQPDTTLAELEEQLRIAKVMEATARDMRIAVEDQILTHFTAPETGEGSKTEGAVSVAWKVTRKVDTDALQAAWQGLGPNAQKAFRWKADTDLKQLRALQDLDADSYAAAAKFITTTPAKPAITLKESDGKQA
ncbi:hypothetical protein H4CHR_01549 [Variovorax sp. PBS-H4]|uniref:DUF7173 family protein n=1 Tax=Variovorax sp. PBS-H4 TaxID=434008 RepID=UPI001316AC27|nr:hypothetical protein [Variovorax sp. PBS-H4]VTU25211.1 hypothetical protein H4CHR_01549 [Variovorax sp. PBS-H4]